MTVFVPNLKMQVISLGIACGSYQANLLTLLNLLLLMNQVFFIMGISRKKPMIVFNDNEFTIPTKPAFKDNFPTGRSHKGVAAFSININTFMKSPTSRAIVGSDWRFKGPNKFSFGMVRWIFFGGSRRFLRLWGFFSYFGRTFVSIKNGIKVAALIKK